MSVEHVHILMKVGEGAGGRGGAVRTAGRLISTLNFVCSDEGEFQFARRAVGKKLFDRTVHTTDTKR